MQGQVMRATPGVLAQAMRSEIQAGGALVAAITGFGLLLRLYRLDHLSFWLDEGYSAWMATAAPLSAWMHDVHPPLYYALLVVWGMWSDSDWWLRLLSVIFGTATIPLVHGIGRRLFNAPAGYWSAALLSGLYVHVAYSQETRMYSLMVLLFTGAFWGLVVGAREGRVVGWIAYAGSGSLLAYAHGLGCMYVLILAGLYPFIAEGSPRWWSRWRQWLVANSIVVLAFAAYGVIYARQIREVTGEFWIPPETEGPPILATLFHFTVRPIPPPWRMLTDQLDVQVSPHLGQWVWLAPILLALFLAIAGVPPERRRIVGGLVLAYGAPILLLTAVSVLVRPLLIPRVLLPTVIPVVLLLGSLAASASRRRWRRLGLAAVLLVLLAGDFYGFRYDTKEQWREASLHLQRHVRPTDVVLVNLDIGRFLIERYDRRGALTGVPKLATDELAARCGGDEVACLEQALRAYARGQTVWRVEGHRIKGTGETSADRWLAAHLEPRERARMVGVYVERTTLTH